jgi:hypothetical protein
MTMTIQLDATLPVDATDLERLFRHWERGHWQDQLNHALVEALNGRLQRDAMPHHDGGDQIDVCFEISRDAKGYIVDAGARDGINQFLTRFLDHLSDRPGVVVWWMRPEFTLGKGRGCCIRAMVSVS